MANIKNFEEIEAWQLARQMCRKIEQIFRETHLGQNYSLRNQMERSSGSIMDNIAEGYGRGGNQEFHNFLSYSKGSTSELKSQLYRAKDKGLISSEQLEDLLFDCNKIEGKIGAFMFYLRKSNYKGLKFKNPNNEQ